MEERKINRQLARAKRLYLCGRTGAAKRLCRRLRKKMDASSTWDSCYEPLQEVFTLLGRICLRQGDLPMADYWFGRLRQLLTWFAREYDEDPRTAELLLADYGLALAKFRMGDYGSAFTYSFETGMIAEKLEVSRLTPLQKKAYRGAQKLRRLLC